MERRTYYYARVSTREQNLERQIEAFKQLGANERDIITDKESGKNLERAGYQALKQTMLRAGDTLVIKSLDRLSRNKKDIADELRYFKENKIRLQVIDIPTTMIDLDGNDWVLDMVNNILIEVLSSIAQQERERIKQNQKDGYNAMPQDAATGKKKSAKTGNVVGRPALLVPKNWNEVFAKWKAGEITAKTAMELTGTKRTSFYKLVKQQEETA